tara:strand:+ start:216 stop:524 length:309 start_codon:yes stop_codon:yes gene_type:complete
MNTKEKVEYWLAKYPELRDNDYRLCANIWRKEIELYVNLEKSNVRDFLMFYSLGKLTSAPSIKRARAKLQEENPHYRGEKYYKRKGIYQEEWRKKLGYEIRE